VHGDVNGSDGLDGFPWLALFHVMVYRTVQQIRSGEGRSDQSDALGLQTKATSLPAASHARQPVSRSQLVHETRRRIKSPVARSDHGK
jgi:hypothetical protein